MWNMVTMIPAVDEAFGTAPKGQERRLRVLEIRERIETIPTTALINSTRILRRVREC